MDGGRATETKDTQNSPERIPPTMRAAVVREHGGPENVRVGRIPRPSVEEPGSVVVRVGACSLNRLDIFARLGLTGPGVRATHLPHVSGVDVAGEIVETGAGVRGWEAGSRVVVYPIFSCGSCRFCEGGEETMCPMYEIFGEDTQGGLAEYCRVPAANLEPLPDHVAFEKAAALPVAYTTAWRMVVIAGELRPHERVLVLGAGGGVGVAAVQIARRIGASVFGVTSGGQRTRRLSELGADRTIDRTTEDFEEVVAAETGGAGVGLVVNPVGGSTWCPAIRSLEPGGRMTICGATIGDDPDLSVRELYQSHRRILGTPLGNRRDFRAVLDLLSRGELDPVVGASLSLESIAEAHRMVEDNEVFGKVVLAP